MNNIDLILRERFKTGDYFWDTYEQFDEEVRVWISRLKEKNCDEQLWFADISAVSFNKVGDREIFIEAIWHGLHETSRFYRKAAVSTLKEQVKDLLLEISDKTGKSSQSDPLNPVLTDPLYHTCKKVLSISC